MKTLRLRALLAELNLLCYHRRKATRTSSGLIVISEFGNQVSSRSISRCSGPFGLRHDGQSTCRPGLRCRSPSDRIRRARILRALTQQHIVRSGQPP